MPTTTTFNWDRVTSEVANTLGVPVFCANIGVVKPEVVVTFAGDRFPPVRMGAVEMYRAHPGPGDASAAVAALIVAKVRGAPAPDGVHVAEEEP